ncbi:MAG: hypothetical protein SFV52_11125 [Saprospiraceae bacterium]|nr:hypothetical protein [Saprospiraceae bacterium]
MKKTKLLQTLQSLNPEERKKWPAFLESPLAHAHRDAVRLAQLISTQTGAPGGPAPDKRAVFAAVYGPDAPYDELRFNNIVSDLYGVLLDFLAHLDREANPLQKQAEKVWTLLNRHLDKQAAQEHKKWRTLLDQNPERDARWMRLEAQWWECLDLLHHRQARQPTGEFLQRQAETTFTTHRLENMRLAIAALNRGTLAITSDEQAPDWFRRLQAGTFGDPEAPAPPALALYTATLILLQEPSDAHFYALTRLLENHPTVVPRPERLALYQCAINYCIRRINDGKSEAYTDILHLYKQLINQDLLVQNGVLSQWTYKNIATAGLRSGEYTWTESFLTSHSRHLPEADRNSALAFNLASLQFEKGAYPDALRTLQGVDFTDITYHLGAKILQIKVFYITDEPAILRALLAATRQLIRRTRSLSAFGKTTNLNFLSALQQIAKLKENHHRKNSPAWRELRRKIEEMHPLANKDWLLRITAIGYR